MKRRLPEFLLIALLSVSARLLLPQTAPPSPAGKQNTATQAPKKSAPKATPGAAAMTNQDVIKMVQAGISEDLIIAKIKQSRTRFDTSVDGLVALKSAGVSERLLSVIMDPKSAPAAASPAAANPPAAPRPALAPADTGPKPAVATGAGTTPRTKPESVEIGHAPANYGVYIAQGGELKPLGRIQTKVQVSKFRTLLKSVVPFVRQKVDVNIPGAHSTSRFEALRPTFYAFFPSSRDVSKFKLLQAKITGQNFDQRTVANASIMFSTEQNQDEVRCDIGPTPVKDLYRIAPREDLPTGEFGLVEGNTGSKSASNIEILDVYDFAIDRKEEKLPLKDYLDTLPAVTLADTQFLTWTKEDSQKMVDDREAKLGISGSLLGWFKRQYASLSVYWADDKFARAFARLEMMDRELTDPQATKLCSLLLSPNDSQYFILVSVGGKVGSGRLIGANEGERLMRPFDASLTSDKGKDVVSAKRLEFIGGYAGLWKVAFDRASIKGPLLAEATRELVFEARLNQNLEFRGKFPADVARTAP